MNPFPAHLQLLLQLAAAMQLGVAILNLFLDRMMKWKSDLNHLPLLIREVFYVHSWFITITLTIFALMTWRFSSEMAAGTNAVCRWLAACIGIFWAFRTILQVTFYSASHWRGQTGRTLIHIILLIMYGGFAFAYLTAAFGNIR
jgi:hypothetical protein